MIEAFADGPAPAGRRFPVGTPSNSRFAHRLNPDGTVDSICLECFVTVAKSPWEAGLENAERIHTCDPWLLQRFKAVRVEEPRL